MSKTGRAKYSIKSKDLALQDSSMQNLHTAYLHDSRTDLTHLERLLFQVDGNHYFAHVATVIDLVLQDEDAFNKEKENYIKIFSAIRDDLLYLQKNFIIKSK